MKNSNVINIRRKMLFLLFVVIVLLTLVNCKIVSEAKVGDESTSSDGTWYYKVITEPSGKKNGTCTITGTTRSGAITIPNTIKNKGKKKTYTVVALGYCDEYFYKNPNKKSFDSLYSSKMQYDRENGGKWSKVTSVKCATGSSVKVISSETFCALCGSAPKLKTVVIPKSCIYIGVYAFDSNYLAKIDFENGSKLKTVCEDAFHIEANIYFKSKSFYAFEDAFACFYGIAYVDNKELYNSLLTAVYDADDADDVYSRVVMTNYVITYKVPTSIGAKTYNIVVWKN